MRAKSPPKWITKESSKSATRIVPIPRPLDVLNHKWFWRPPPVRPHGTGRHPAPRYYKGCGDCGVRGLVQCATGRATLPPPDPGAGPVTGCRPSASSSAATSRRAAPAGSVAPPVRPGNLRSSHRRRRRRSPVQPPLERIRAILRSSCWTAPLPWMVTCCARASAATWGFTTRRWIASPILRLATLRITLASGCWPRRRAICDPWMNPPFARFASNASSTPSGRERHPAGLPAFLACASPGLWFRVGSRRRRQSAPDRYFFRLAETDRQRSGKVVPQNPGRH